jgi:hypothetical protein
MCCASRKETQLSPTFAQTTLTTAVSSKTEGSNYPDYFIIVNQLIAKFIAKVSDTINHPVSGQVFTNICTFSDAFMGAKKRKRFVAELRRSVLKGTDRCAVGARENRLTADRWFESSASNRCEVGD